MWMSRKTGFSEFIYVHCVGVFKSIKSFILKKSVQLHEK